MTEPQGDQGTQGPIAGTAATFVANTSTAQTIIPGIAVAHSTTILPAGKSITRVNEYTFRLNTRGTYRVTISLPTCNHSDCNAAAVVNGRTIAVFAPISSSPSVINGTISFSIDAASTFEIHAVGGVALDLRPGASIVIELLA